MGGYYIIVKNQHTKQLGNVKPNILRNKFWDIIGYMLYIVDGYEMI